MDNIRESIRILFNSSNIEEKIKVLFKVGSNEEFYFFKYRENIFYNSKNMYNHEEVGRLEQILKNNWTKLHNSNENIFNILIEYTKEILIEKNNEIFCKYSKLFKWRELTLTLGEDIFTTSYLAYNDIFEEYERENFDWGWIVKTDNLEIKGMLSQGVAENHFHLLGSAPYFDVFWIYFMNGIILEENSQIKDYIETISQTLNPIKNPFEYEKKLKMYDLLKIAAAIRSYLFYKIKSPELDLDELFFDFLENNSDESFTPYKNNIKNLINIDNLLFEEINLKNEYDYIEQLLYQKKNRIFSSERAFMYMIFKKSFQGNSWEEINNRLFYIYLLIKNILKNEMMYFEKMYSLDDFLEFNKRKNMYFLPEKYKKILYSEIMKNAYDRQNIKNLEIRINFNNILKNIKNIDGYLKNDDYTCNYFYVLHYTKIKDNEIEKINENKGLKNIYQKDSKSRKNIRKQTLELIELYRDFLSYGELENDKRKVLERILGIDAAGRELNCNPEVFGQAYRALRKMSRHKKLWFTYHVGEDFIDLVTGLRRIDEALEYLELEAYDRLGHALALGIKPQEVYLRKNNKLLLKKGELLDNIAWLLMYIRTYNIFFDRSPREYLEIKYKELMKYIYGKIYDPVIYSEVWLLRGDGTFYKDKDNEYDIYWETSIEREPNNKNLQRIRKMVLEDKEISELYRNYFLDYDTNVKCEEIIEFQIPDGYEKLVEKIQNIIQKKIKEKRISIETNPTSNYLISYLNQYQDHPIRNFFNIGLEIDNKEISKCHQLHVSINTDDQGIFYTCLENEYALVALSLEKLKDLNGRQIYSSYQVYEWLNKIREMGLQQSFANR